MSGSVGFLGNISHDRGCDQLGQVLQQFAWDEDWEFTIGFRKVESLKTSSKAVSVEDRFKSLAGEDLEENASMFSTVCGKVIDGVEAWTNLGVLDVWWEKYEVAFLKFGKQTEERSKVEISGGTDDSFEVCGCVFFSNHIHLLRWKCGTSGFISLKFRCLNQAC